MIYSIIFIGKYDKNLHSLEEDAINIHENSNKNADRITLELQNIPDVKRYRIEQYACDIWTIIGNVKPTILLKGLLFKANLIIYYLDISQPDSFNFLTEGWGPIINQVLSLNPKNQKRILIASQTKSIKAKSEIEHQILKLKSDFRCDTVYKKEENAQSINEYLINYLKQTLNNEIEEEIKIENEINYKLSKKNKTAEIIKSPNAKGKIVIKKCFDSCEITRICNDAFTNTNIEHVVFLCSDYEIGKNAFKNCKFLKRITFYNANKVTFDNNCFDCAENISSFLITECFEITLKENCFTNCSSLNEISCESQKIKIFSNSFSNCICLSNIKLICDSIDIDLSLIDIPSLSSFDLNIRKQSLSFKKSDFQKCRSLKYLKIICDSSISFEKACFNKFINLKYIQINSKNLIKIDNNCFNENSSIKSVNIKARSVEIGDFSFYGSNRYKNFSIKCSDIKISDNCKITEENIKKISDNNFESYYDSDLNSSDHGESDDESNDGSEYESEYEHKDNDDKSDNDSVIV